MPLQCRNDVITQIANPTSRKPALRFATVGHSHTEATLRRHHSGVHAYMRAFGRFDSTAAAVRAVKDG